jgi:hypothetical protein
VAELEDGGQHVLGDHAEAGGQLLVGPGDPRRGVAQPLALGVLADRDEQLAHGRGGPLVVERRHVGR